MNKPLLLSIFAVAGCAPADPIADATDAAADADVSFPPDKEVRDAAPHRADYHYGNLRGQSRPDRDDRDDSRNYLGRMVSPDAGPTREYCDGLDNDADGEVDEGVLNACGYCGSTPDEVLGGDVPGDEDCDGVIDEGFLGGQCETWRDCEGGADGVGMECVEGRCAFPCSGCRECNEAIQQYHDDVREDGDALMLVPPRIHELCQRCLHACDPVGGVCVGTECQMRRDLVGECREDQRVFTIHRQWFVETPQGIVTRSDEVLYCRENLW